MTVFECTLKLIGAKYNPGKMDCLHMVYDFLVMRGYNPPSCFKTYTIDNYFSIYKDTPYAIKDLLMAYFGSFMCEVKSCDLRTGDIAVVSYNYSIPFSVVVIDNNECLVATKTIVTKANMNIYTFIGGFRWPE